MSKLFISHSSRDNAQALAINQWLKAQGWNDQFLDLDPERGIVAGERWEQALHQAANNCEAVLFLISPNWLTSDWCLREFRLANKLNKQIFGVLIEDVAVADLPLELTEVWQLVNLDCGTDHCSPITVELPNGKLTYITFSLSGLTRLKAGLAKAGLEPRFFAWPPAHDPTRPPYRGLLPLEEEDAGIFFGREAPLIALLARLRGLREAAAPRLLAILGASGAGKSSFLRAGLLPRLARDDRHFYPLPLVRPERAALFGNNGFLAMLVELNKRLNLGYNRAQLRGFLNSDTADISALFSSLSNRVAPPLLPGETPRLPPTLVLPLDQAEELFLAEGRDEADALLALLAKLLMNPELGLMVVATIRSDTYEYLQTSGQLDSLPQHTFSLPPLAKGSYQQVIEGPALLLEKTQRPLRIEPQLTQQLLEDLDKGGAKDALPLLAFTLERLYREYGDDGDLNLDEYQQMGGIQGVIEAAVENALKDAISSSKVPISKTECLQLLRQGMIPWLAGIDPLTQQPRRRIALMKEIPEKARDLIEHFVQHHLLATDLNEMGDITIEPAHESLLRQWRCLRSWLEEDSATLSTLESLQAAARDWQTNGCHASWLVHNQGRLEDAEALFERDDLGSFVRPVDREYLGQCRATENAQKNKALEEARQLAQTQLLVVRRTRFGLAAALALLVIAGGMALWAINNAHRAQQHLTHANALLTKIRGNLNFMNNELQDVLQRYVPIDARISVIQKVDELVEALDTTGGDAGLPSREIAFAYLNKADLMLRNQGRNSEEVMLQYQAAHEMFKTLLAQDPSSLQSRRDFSLSSNKIGDTALGLGEIHTARDHYQTSLDIRKAIAVMDPDNMENQRDLSVSYNKLGDVAMHLGFIQAATDYYQAGLEVAKILADRDPGNNQAQRDLGISYNKLGNTSLRQDDTQAAMDYYQMYFEITKALANLDPGNRAAQRDLALAHVRLGDINLQQNRFQNSQMHYQTNFDIAKKLAELDPDNTQNKRDLGLAYDRLGDISLRLEDIQNALEYYNAGLAIRDTADAADPGNMRLQRDLSISHERLGDTYIRLHDNKTAVDHYQKALDIRTTLVSRDADNAEVLRDLFVSESKLGDALIKTKQLGSARQAYQRGRDILLSMRQRGILEPNDEKIIPILDSRINSLPAL